MIEEKQVIKFCRYCIGKHFSMIGDFVYDGDCGCLCHKRRPKNET
jgi:hypothetical protein